MCRSHVACLIIHVYSRAFGDASRKTWMSWDMPLYFFSKMRGGPHSDVKARHFLFAPGGGAEVDGRGRRDEENDNW